MTIDGPNQRVFATGVLAAAEPAVLRMATP